MDDPAAGAVKSQNEDGTWCCALKVDRSALGERCVWHVLDKRCSRRNLGPS
jgi:hypothetical protein